VLQWDTIENVEDEQWHACDPLHWQQQEALQLQLLTTIVRFKTFDVLPKQDVIVPRNVKTTEESTYRGKPFIKKTLY